MKIHNAKRNLFAGKVGTGNQHCRPWGHWNMMFVDLFLMDMGDLGSFAREKGLEDSTNT